MAKKPKDKVEWDKYAKERAINLHDPYPQYSYADLELAFTWAYRKGFEESLNQAKMLKEEEKSVENE